MMHRRLNNNADAQEGERHRYTVGMQMTEGPFKNPIGVITGDSTTTAMEMGAGDSTTRTMRRLAEVPPFM